MPHVTLRTGIESDGQEEVLHEYLCDWPNCSDVAVHVVAFVKEIGFMSVMCDEHAAIIKGAKPNTTS